MPSAEVGAEVRRKRALNCWPWMRSLTPCPGRGQPFPGRDGRGMADDRHQVAAAARLDPQDAEAAVDVMEGDALDGAGQDFLVWRCRLRPAGAGAPHGLLACVSGVCCSHWVDALFPEASESVP